MHAGPERKATTRVERENARTLDVGHQRLCWVPERVGTTKAAESWKSAPGTGVERSVNGTESHTADAAQHFDGRIALTTPCRGH
jgi:hypothetical protein